MSGKIVDKLMILVEDVIFASLAFALLGYFVPVIPVLWAELLKSAVLFAVLFALFYPAAKKHWEYLDIRHFSFKKLAVLPVCAASLLFMVMVYIPFDAYLSAFNEFHFTWQTAALALLARFLPLLAAVVFITAGIGGKMRDLFLSIASALCLGVYIQYMFMNVNLHAINGEEVNWNAHPLFSAFNAAIWLIIFLAPFVLYLKNKKLWSKLTFFVPLVLGAVHLLSFAMLVITVPKAAGMPNVRYASGEDQYKVASEHNIIVLVFDGVDNDYVDDIFAASPDLKNELCDFTVYTNTCSVFDSTTPSMAQMFTGCSAEDVLNNEDYLTYAWQSETAEDFYTRLHDAGYTINYYNMEGSSGQQQDNTFDLMEGKVDNIRQYTKEELKKHGDFFDKSRIADYFCLLSEYKALPYALKRLCPINFFNTDDLREKRLRTASYTRFDNTEFEKDLDLSIKQGMDKAYIMQHLVGTHDGDSTQHCFDILLEYLDMLKQLGVYDTADIIVTSDHGKHNDNDPGVYATPMFMIKRAGQKHPQTVFTSAPIYHTDIPATILTCAGLYDSDKDKARYGTDIYAWAAQDKRERTWYDRAIDRDYPAMRNDVIFGYSVSNVYYAYTYTGDREVLKKMVAENIITKIYPMKAYVG